MTMKLKWCFLLCSFFLLVFSQSPSSSPSYVPSLSPSSLSIITTIAGTGAGTFGGDGGAATSAYIQYPHGVTVDTSGKTIKSVNCSLLCYMMLTAIIKRQCIHR